MNAGVMSRQYKAEQQGELFGVLSSLYTLASFVGPLIFNTLFSCFASIEVSIPSDSSRHYVEKAVLWLMAVLHSNGPGLIYYLVSIITLVSLCVSCAVFMLWKDRTAVSPLDVIIEEEDPTQDDYDARGRIVGDYDYEKVLIIMEDEFEA